MDALTPAGFVGHCSPMNTLDHNRYTDVLRTFGESVERRRALLVVSAHWYTNATAVTAIARPRTIHDLYGFPDELFAFDYPAAGAPEVAAQVAEVIKSLQPLDYHLDIGARLAPLRDQGILIMGSGNVVHNLRRIDRDNPIGGFDWARRFDDAARQLMVDAPGDILKLTEHDDYDPAVPTPDHFIPLLYTAALSAATNETLSPSARRSRSRVTDLKCSTARVARTTRSRRCRRRRSVRGTSHSV